MQNEKIQMSGIIPLNAQSKAFESLIENALNLVVQDGEVRKILIIPFLLYYFHLSSFTECKTNIISHVYLKQFKDNIFLLSLPFIVHTHLNK